MPPVTLTMVPVIPAAWSEARNTATRAMSASRGERRVIRIWSSWASRRWNSTLSRRRSLFTAAS
jgi:hypothetical protein